MKLFRQSNIIFVEGVDVYPRRDVLKHIGFNFDDGMKMWFIEDASKNKELIQYIYNTLLLNEVAVTLGENIDPANCIKFAQKGVEELRKKLYAEKVLVAWQPPVSTPNIHVAPAPLEPEPPTPKPSRISKNVKEVPIFFRHLNPAGKAILMAEFGIKDAKELGWDENPIATLIQVSTIEQKK